MRGRLGLLGPDVEVDLIADQSTFLDTDDGRRELHAFVDRAFDVWSGQADTRPPGRAAIDLLRRDDDRAARAALDAAQRDRRRRARGRAPDRRSIRSPQHAPGAAARRDRRRGRDRQDDAGGREGAAARARGLSDAAGLLQLAAGGDARGRGRRAVAGAAGTARCQDVPPAVRGPRARGRACCRERPAPVPQDWWDRTLPRALDEAVEQLGPRYHAIVVDEGQDFAADWLAVARGAAVRRSPGRPVRLPRPGAGDLPRRRHRAVSDLPTFPLETNCRNAQPIHAIVERLAEGGLVGEALRTDGRPPEFIEAADGPSDRRGAAQAPASTAGRGGGQALGHRGAHGRRGSRTRPCGTCRGGGSATRSWAIPPSTTPATISASRAHLVPDAARAT